MFQFLWSKTFDIAEKAGPLDHPAVRRMTADQLADLPLTPDWPHQQTKVSATSSEVRLSHLSVAS